MRRILLLMTSNTYRARAFLAAAESLGVAVVVGTDKAQVLAAANPAGNLTLDFHVPERGAERVLAYAREHPIAAVVAADDEGVLLAAYVSAALGLASSPVEAIAAARNKRLGRERHAAAGLKVPRYWTAAVAEDARELARRVRYPCVLKPLALSASRGVIRADNEIEFRAAHRRLLAILAERELAKLPGTLASEILIESFIPGFEVSLEGLMSEGRLRVLALFDKPDPLDGPFFEETIYVTPSRHGAEVVAAIAATTQDAVAALGLTHGPIHAELRVNAAGVWPLEIAPRSIGGLCARSLLFTSSAGDALVSLEELILRQALGEDVSGYARERRPSGVMMIPIPRAGLLAEVKGLDAAAEVPGVDDLSITVPRGQRLVPLPEGSRYLGFIFAHAETAAEVEAALRRAHANLEIVISPDPEVAGPAPC